MTATQVNGQQVVADEPALSPLSTSERPVWFRQVRHLLLADSSEVFGCVHCTYTAPSAHQVRSHLVKHSRRGTDPRPGSFPSTRLEGALNELLARPARGDAAQTQLAAMTKDRERWKECALVAEKDLAVIRRAVNGS